MFSDSYLKLMSSLTTIILILSTSFSLIISPKLSFLKLSSHSINLALKVKKSKSKGLNFSIKILLISSLASQEGSEGLLAKQGVIILLAKQESYSKGGSLRRSSARVTC